MWVQEGVKEDNIKGAGSKAIKEGKRKARGRREMPDSGTKTQRERWLITEGWMLGR